MRTKSVASLLEELRAHVLDPQALALIDEAAKLYAGAEDYFARQQQSIEDEIALLKRFASLDESEARFRLAHEEREKLRLEREALRKKAELDAARARIGELTQENELLARHRRKAEAEKATALSQWSWHIATYEKERQLLSEEAAQVEKDLKKLGIAWLKTSDALEQANERDKAEFRAKLMEKMQQSLSIQRRMAGQEERLLLAGLFHFIRNQVDGIQGAAQLLQERAAKMIPEAARRFSLPVPPELKGELDFLSRVLKENWLAVERLRSGLDEFAALAQTAELRTEVTDLPALARSFLDARQAELQGLSVRCKLDPVPPVFVDRVAVEAALAELVRNALDAQPENGTLDLETFSEEAWSGLILRDGGPGIPGHLLEKIFYPFFTTKPGRSGLGLARALHWITRVGGAITAHPAERGAEFRIRLPVQPVE